MNFFESLRLRRMCRDYKSDAIPDEVVDRLIYAARRAPQGGNVGTRTLVVIQDKSIIHMMRLVSPGFGNEPPLAIAICTDETVAQDRSIATFDAGAAAENIALAGVSLGLGTAFVKSYPEAAMKRILCLPPHMTTEIIITIGYPSEQQPPAPKAPTTPLFINTYGNLARVNENSNTSFEEDRLLELALYMLTSARTTIDEPSRYGPKRLMDSLQRLLAMQKSLKAPEEDVFLDRIRSTLEERTDMQISSVVYTEQFKRFLDDLIENFVDELGRRQRTPRSKSV